MQNQPFPPSGLKASPMAFLQHSQLATAEGFLLGLSQILVTHFPFLKDAIGQVVEQASQQIQSAEEEAARIYFTEVLHTERIPDVASMALMGKLIETYLPTLFNQPHPLSPAQLLGEAFLAQPSVSFSIAASQSPEALYADLDTAPSEAFQSQLAIFSDTPQSIIFMRLATFHWLLLEPESRQWQILTYDATEQHFFRHRQLESLPFPSLEDLEEAIRRHLVQIFVASRPNAQRSLYKPRKDIDTTLGVQLTQLFQYPDIRTLNLPGLSVDGAPSYRLWTVEHPSLGTVLAMQSIEESNQPQIVLYFRSEDISHYYLLMQQNQLHPVALESLSTFSKNVLSDLFGLVIKQVVKAKKRKPH